MQSTCITRKGRDVRTPGDCLPAPAVGEVGEPVAPGTSRVLDGEDGSLAETRLGDPDP